MNVEIVLHEPDATIVAIATQPTIMEEIKQRQLEDEFLQKICDELETKPKPEFKVENSVLKFPGRWCVFNVPEIKKRIMEGAHSSKFTMHPGNTKMYHNLKQNFWWPGMKRETAEYAQYNADKLATIYVDEIVRLHGIPISIVSDRDPKFVSRFG
ncbi:uncharacterized protein LOC114279205 [Camellia sinensis]|uniref:uncharacterized protein LOC114279205 n=1 Tax=Camellia sinensis TaxID=4442 RepID=UPI0010356DEB|nr:uncharacterized protein LOC114279205 [Camellia sinensis]